jgi:tRNA(Ile)-lysidine synthase
VRAVAVATSGGRDSTALLHSTVRAAHHLGIRVVALHVHHGLQVPADDWLAHVKAQARRWGADFDCRRITASPPAGESVEAWARRVRYAALAEMAQTAGCGLVLLAHHRRDQAETWLLQALRGGGAAGLSAMPRQIERAGIGWCRPWLDAPREAIESYVQRHRLRFVEDPSNADPRHARNRLRSAVWPALLTAFPQAESTFAAAAAQAQAHAALAAEVLVQDLPLMLDDGGGLRVAAWLDLPPARRRNALQGWLRQALGRGAPETLLARLNAELAGCRAGTWDAPGHDLRLYRGILRAVGSAAAAVAPAAPALVRTAADLAAPVALDLSWPGLHPVPDWGGSWRVESVKTGGLAASLLQDARVAPRRGGERFSLATGATARSLKKQFQARAIPAWQRSGPLLFSADGRLLWVPGLGVDARLEAASGEPQLRVSWMPDPATPTGRRQHGG